MIIAKDRSDSELFLIVNPHAGGGTGRKDWPNILSLLEITGVSFNFKITEYKMQATQLAVEAIENGYKTLIAVGGDGTLNERKHNI